VEAVARIEKATQAGRTRSDAVADVIANFCGSMGFVWVHVFVFATWLLLNTLPGIPKHLQFDPPPYAMLTLVVSLEAIFLSTFILISQNRQQRASEKRNHLDLQINLLAEQESSLLITMTRKLMEHFGLDADEIPVKEWEDLTDAKEVAREIEETIDPDSAPGER
jgi:uncharacterized membrane protein